MKFSEYHYHRPNYDDIKEQLTTLTQELTQATTYEETLKLVQAITEIHNTIDTQMNLWMIRHSIDATDEFYNEETTFWNEYSPLFDELLTNYYRVIVDSPFRNELSDFLPETFFLMAENKLQTFSSDIIPLLQEENRLVDQYNALMATASVTVREENYNLSQVAALLNSPERALRKEATTAIAAYFSAHESEFDTIYDKMVKTRHQIATTLGFKDYVEYGYKMMNRFDYNREMVKTYRQEIQKHLLPLLASLRKRQANRIQVEHLQVYDQTLEFLNGNATPKGTPEELVALAQKMYHELSAETGEFFDFMVEHDLLDLLAKDGKDTGGYCTYITDYQSPFIFANFNGSSADIDVLTHEAGHAFQVYNSRWIKTPEVVWPTYESCEIHSMSMEFMTWPWMDSFFHEEAEKYKFSHLSGALFFLPYGVLVDHFQHEVYEHPHWTPAERKEAWRHLEKHYLPDRDYSEIPDLERGIFWFRQRHIFTSPFYYIDYTLAQVCALQFWKRTQIDHDQTAWQDYLHICQIGGTQSFLQIVAAAHLQSPFEEGALESTIQAAADYLDAIDDTQL